MPYNDLNFFARLPRPSKLSCFELENFERRQKSWIYIGTAQWAFAPGSGRLDRMYLELRPGGKEATLWSSWPEDDRPGAMLYREWVTARFRKATTPREAAIVLLKAGYEFDEEEFGSLAGKRPDLRRFKLISEEDYAAIWLQVFGEPLESTTP